MVYELNDEIKVRISSSYNVPKIIVAVVQTVSSCIAFYKSRGYQVDRYGYAAFGLTILPYTVMSIVNLIGNLLTPDYPTLYLVRSPEMAEAEAEAEMKKTEAEAKMIAETQAETEAEIQGEAQTETQTKTQAETQSQTQAESQAVGKPLFDGVVGIIENPLSPKKGRQNSENIPGDQSILL